MIAIAFLFIDEMHVVFHASQPSMEVGVSSARYGTKNRGSLLTSNDIKLKAGEVSVLSKVYPLGGRS